MLAEDGDSKRINGSANQNFSVLPIEIGPFDFLTHGIGPVQHPIVVIDRQTAGLREIFVDNGALQRSRHRGLENFSGRPKAAPIREIKRAVTGIDDDGAWTIHACDHYQIRAIDIHRVDAIVGGIRPINFLLSPIIRDALGIDSLADQCMQIRGGRSVRRGPRNFRPRSNLSEQKFLVLIVKVYSDHVCQISNWRKRYIGIVRVQINGANLSSRGEHQVFLDVFARTAVRGEFTHRAIADKCFRTVLGKSKAQLGASTIRRLKE